MSDKKQPFMDRRGFLKKIFGGSEVTRSFFAVQVVFDAAGHEELRARLQALIDAPGEETIEEKRRLYRRLTSVLAEAEPFFEYAFFEYVPDSSAARDKFEEWVVEIEASFAGEDEEISDEIDGYRRLSNEQRYIVVSLIFLVEGPHPDHGKEISEDELYTRAGVGGLIDSINRLRYDRVMADAAYLIPGSPEDGFSWADFADEGWSYLVSLPY